MGRNCKYKFYYRKNIHIAFDSTFYEKMGASIGVYFTIGIFVVIFENFTFLLFNVTSALK